MHLIYLVGLNHVFMEAISQMDSIVLNLKYFL